MKTNLTCAMMYLLVGWMVASCKKSEPLFESLPADYTGIHFNNTIEENEEDNIYTYMNIYTGAGVSVGDINNDGLTDLYFSGNQISGRLYLNKGDMRFEDITSSSGVGHSRWGTGTIMEDFNQDGWLDIYVCVSGSDSTDQRANLLYINNHDNTFTESAVSFGLADTRQTMHAAVLDYDRDGDLDLFLIVNPASYENNVNIIQPRKLNGEGASTDVLYRNNGDNTFTDVSKETGILTEGYSLGVAISDMNDDGWPDIYISNDFISNDVMYINNQDGTFTNRSKECLKHTSFAGMGNDVADINNDGLVDIVVLDMRPEDNLRQKLIIPASGYDKFQLSLKAGYEPQFTRNTLQLNYGVGKFGEIGFLSGISSTDWSWSALLADYDNDGDKDLFVTNGFLRDLGNLDYITYQNIYNTAIGTEESKRENKLEKIKTLEGAFLRNYIFENTGDLKFSDRSIQWGMDEKNCSHGAAYADLDNDGDLDLVISTLNQRALIYKNNSDEFADRKYLRIKFSGDEKNKNGIGAKVIVKCRGQKQFFENYHSRGFESSVDPVLHIGLDTASFVDSLEVIWPDGKFQLIKNVKSNQLLTLNYQNASQGRPVIDAHERFFTEVTAVTGIDYQHKENAFVDFKIQPLLPHLHSRQGPAMAAGDVNGDGLDDFYVGGSVGHAGALYIQKMDGTFVKQQLILDSLVDQTGILFFDADLDGDPDLYLASGGTEHTDGSIEYTDHLYTNDGKGNFTLAPGALPDIRESSSCVVAADYDRDGDLDLFVGGRIVPGLYPLPANSHVLRNDTERGNCRFTDVTKEVVPSLSKIGLVTSALWSDYDNDGWTDLIIAGEFMPITVYHNDQGKQFTTVSDQALRQSSGWWNSLAAGDFDNDGDTDYMGGNLGLNTRYIASNNEPLCIYAKDFDKNGSIDPIMSYYLNGEKHILHFRDELISQISAIRARFRNYKDYAEATFEESFLPSELENAYNVCSEKFETSYIENLGGGKFAIRALPLEAQFAPVYGMVTGDYNGDGYLDLLLVGNSYSTEVNTGQYDASAGLYLKGDGKGNFVSVTPANSGFIADSEGKSLLQLLLKDGSQLVLAGNTSGPLKAYKHSNSGTCYSVRSQDAYAVVTLKNGTTFKHEFYYGSTYLSQSSRVLRYTADVRSVKVVDFAGREREWSPSPGTIVKSK